MTRRKKFAAIVRTSLFGLCGAAVLTALVPAAARAQTATCNGFIHIDYVDPPDPLMCGDMVTVRINFGTGLITGAVTSPAPPPFLPTDLVLSAGQFSFFLACSNAAFPCLQPDPLAGLVAFVPGSVTDNCGVGGVSIFSGAVNAGDSNRVDFTATPNLVMPANVNTVPPGFCALEFQIRMLGQNTNPTPPPPALPINESVGYTVAQCNNGKLVSSGAQSSSVTPECVNFDFDCYETKISPHLTGEPITLDDMFLPQQVTVPRKNLTPVKRVCAPAVKVTAMDPDPPTPTGIQHLVGYAFSTTPPFKAVKGVTLKIDQFPGPVTLDVVRPVLLLVPSDKNGENTGGVAEKSNHFLCYALDNVKAASPGVVTTRDQFGDTTIEQFSGSKSWRLCAPVDKNGEDPFAESNSTGLFCYDVKETDKNVVLGVSVSWANQFEINSNKIDKLDDFCVPAHITKPPQP
jgi:hypothetical protein